MMPSHWTKYNADRVNIREKKINYDALTSKYLSVLFNKYL